MKSPRRTFLHLAALGLRTANDRRRTALDLLKVDEVECRDSDQRGNHNDGGHVLHHTGLVIFCVSARFLVSGKIEQLVDIAPGIISGSLMMSIGIVSQPELQNLAAAVVMLLWLAARHRMLNTAFLFKAAGSDPRSRNVTFEATNRREEISQYC